MSKEFKTLPEDILVSKDRLSSILKTYKESIRKEDRWHTPLGIVTSVLLCVAATSSFQEIWLLTNDQVELLVYLSGIISLSWFIYAFFQSRSGKADPNFYLELQDSLKNAPDYTVIYIIKLTKDEIPRILVEKKASWNCYFLPYASRNQSGDFSNQNITDFQKTIASYLGISNEFVSIDHFREFPLVSNKYSPKDRVSKQFNFDFFFFTVPKEKMLDDYEKSPFKVGGKEFYWMTLDELSKDAMTMEKNGDVIQHLEKHFTEFLARTRDSFC